MEALISVQLNPEAYSGRRERGTKWKLSPEFFMSSPPLRIKKLGGKRLKEGKGKER